MVYLLMIYLPDKFFLSANSLFVSANLGCFFGANANAERRVVTRLDCPGGSGVRSLV
jgi:hypothetical protein